MSTTLVPGRARPVQAVLGALALLLGCAALAPLFRTGAWVPPLGIVVAAIVLTGIVMRALRLPLAAVLVGQVLALGVLLTVLFSDVGVFGLLPGPSALAQLRGLLEGAGAQIAAEKPPVAVSTELLVLLTGSLGAAAIVVDCLVAGLQAPAVAGLVLLGIVAVPTSVLRTLLPWPSFALAAVAFLVLLASDGARRRATAGPGAGSPGLRSPAVLAAVGLSLVGALVVGAGATAVGTAGRLSGPPGGSTGIALNPFTQLRGELGQRSATPLFTVSGMAQPTYLRAATLDTFINNRGWVVQNLPAGDAPGPAMGRQQLAGLTQDVTVHGVQYRDRWLPSPGIPVAVRGLDSPLQGYTYSPDTGVLRAGGEQPLPDYGVRAVAPGASPEQLRALGPVRQAQRGADPRWRELDGVDPRVAQLARSIAGTAPTTFDAAVALNAYFTGPGSGFSYDLSTGNTGSGVGSDALVDFLTVTKRGYCEQYASAMAVLLRELGIAARVVLGYTPGVGNAGLRTVTSDDAHAWVEVFFTGVGWVAFDPTPLTGDRAAVALHSTEPGVPPDPATLSPALPATAPPAPPPVAQNDPAVDPTAPAPPDPAAPPSAASDAPTAAPPGWLLGVALAVLLGVLASAPLMLRRWRRRRRAAAGTAEAAWQELVDLGADRGADIGPAETPRQAADRLTTAYGLDAAGAEAVAGVVRAVESRWYSTPERQAVAVSATAVNELDAAWRRCAPLSIWRRVFPRSVTRRRSVTTQP